MSDTLVIGGDLRVNRLGYGAMRLSGAGIWGDPPDRNAAIRLLRRAVETGINFIDTADAYGPETNEIRQGLKQRVGARIDMIWPHDSAKPVSVNLMQSESVPMTERLMDSIRSLKAKDDAQRALQSRAVETAESLLQARWMALVGAENSIPLPLLVILLFWLTIVFVSFGLFAPRNATVIAALFVCSVSVAAALFLVLEMESPLTGFIHVPPDALRHALSSLGK